MKTRLNIIKHHLAQKFIKSNFILSLAISTLLLLGVSSNILAQQWDGSSTIENSIDRNGSVGIGTTTPLGDLHILTGATAAIFERNENNDASPANRFYKSRGTAAAKTQVQTGDNLGQFQFLGMGDDDAYNFAAVLKGVVESTRTGTNVFDVAGSFQFLTTNTSFDYGERMRITADGDVGIGTTNPQGYKLAVAGSAAIDGIVKTTELEVKLDVWSDFVFNDDYKLMPLDQIEKYIKENKHLPDVPSASEVTSNGLKVGEMNAVMMQKIEELTLYLIEQDKKIKKLSSENEALREQIKTIVN